MAEGAPKAEVREVTAADTARTYAVFCVLREGRPVMATAAVVERVKREMPELPAAKRERFASAHGISAYDAGVLTATRALGDYFEAAVKAGAPAKAAANWISVELLRRLKDAGKEMEDCPVAPARLARPK